MPCASHFAAAPRRSKALGLALEDVHELAADDLALLLRIGHAGELAHEDLGRVDVHHAHAEVALESVEHLLGLAEAQQAVIDEHAREPLADRLVDQRRSDRGIHAPG